MSLLWFEQALLPSGWATGVRIEIRSGHFTAVTPDTSPDPSAERYAVALPGLANLHSHAFQRAAAGRTGKRGPDGDSFWTWRAEIYNLAAKLTPESLSAIAALAYAEMLEGGFTHVGEFHYVHHDVSGVPYADAAEMAGRCFEAAVQTGIGVTLLPVFYAHSDIGGAAPRADQTRFVCDVDLYEKILAACQSKAAAAPGSVVGVAPHSIRAVTPEELTVLTTLAPDAPFHIHIAEQTAEVARCRAVLGARPVEWLLRRYNVDQRWCLVHATHVTPDEIRDLAASRATVGLCPITEADLGDGVFPATDYAGAGGAWGVGSDSNVMIDLAGELRLLEYSQRLTILRRNLLASDDRSTGRGLFDAARKGGAQALGADDSGIKVGAPATLVSLAMREPSFLARRGDDVLDAWIFAARRPAVDRVWRAGRLVVKDGEHVCRPEIDRAYRRLVSGMFSD
jgi:formimidoylglutamate deiminase